MKAHEIIEIQKRHICEMNKLMDKRPKDKPRAVYRHEIDNLINVRSFTALVKDLRFKSKPYRQLSFTGSHTPFDLWVFNSAPATVSREYRLIDRIVLRAADADERLSRYEFI